DAPLPGHAVDDERVVHDRGTGVSPVGRDQPPEHPRDGCQVGRFAVRRDEHGRAEPVVAVLERLEHVEVRTQLTVLVAQLLELDVRRGHTARVEERHGWRRYYTARLARSDPLAEVAERASERTNGSTSCGACAASGSRALCGTYRAACGAPRT